MFLLVSYNTHKIVYIEILVQIAELIITTKTNNILIIVIPQFLSCLYLYHFHNYCHSYYNIAAIVVPTELIDQFRSKIFQKSDFILIGMNPIINWQNQYVKEG